MNEDRAWVWTEEVVHKLETYDELLAMLKRSRDAIASLETGILGVGSADGGYTHWYIRDELLQNIELILAKAERMKG